MKIAVVGSLNMDLVVKMERIPSPGETLLGGDFNTHPGGKGANQAVAAARLGAEVYMIGCAGNDAFGNELRTSLENDGINTSYVVEHPKAATGVALIQVDRQGKNSIAVAPGANLKLTGLDVQKALFDIGEIDILILQLEIPLQAVYSALLLASNKKIKTILNPAPAQFLPKNLLELVDFLIPNEYELGILLNNPGLSKKTIHHNYSSIRQYGCKNTIVTLGEDGALIFDQMGNESHIPAFNVKAVDSTAAGDCFVGALAVGLCEGKSLEEAARFASAAASISVTREGAQPSLPYREEVEDFFINRSMEK